MRSLAAGLVAIGLMAVAFPAGAGAETRHVAVDGGDGGDCLDPAAPCATIQHAVDQADDGDVIAIGPGRFLESVLVTGKELEIAGSGAGASDDDAGATIIEAETAADHEPGLTTLTLRSGGIVRDLRVAGGKGGADDEGVGAQGGLAVLAETTGDTGPMRFTDTVMVGGREGDGRYGLKGGPFNAGPSLDVVGENTSAVVADSLITGRMGVVIVEDEGRLSISDSLITAPRGVRAYDARLKIERSQIRSRFTSVVVAAPEADSHAEATVSNSLLVNDFDENIAGIGVSASAPGAAALATVRGSTVIGRGISDAAAIEVGEKAGGEARAVLVNSVAHQFRSGYPWHVDLRTWDGIIETVNSSFELTDTEEGGSIFATGTVAADPGFIDPAGDDFRLRPDSPLIDAGDTSFVEEGETDLLGEPRSQNGVGCGDAPDIGAYELPGEAVECPPSNPPLIPVAPVVETPNSHGNVGRVPAWPPVGPPPKVRSFEIDHREFAPNGTAGGDFRGGARFRFRLSRPGVVLIRIRQLRRDRHGLKELMATCAGRPGGRCPRLARATLLETKTPKLAGTIRFSGRHRGRALEPGLYVATMLARGDGGSSTSKLRFRVRWPSGGRS